MTAQLIPIEEPETIELTTKALSWQERASAISITGQAHYDAAAEMLLGIKDLAKEIVEHHAKAKKDAHEAWKSVCAMEKRALDPLSVAESILKGKIAEWDAEQRRIEAERRRQEQARLDREREEEIERQLAEAEAQGATVAEVESIAEQAAFVAPVAAPKVQTYSRTQGVVTRYVYSVEVVNMRELCRAIADGKVPANYVEPSASLKARRADRDQFSVPGCINRKTPMVSAGRR